MYVHIHVRVRQLSPQFELLNCVEFRPAGFSLARVRFDFSKVSNMEFTGGSWSPALLPGVGQPQVPVAGGPPPPQGLHCPSWGSEPKNMGEPGNQNF